MHFIFVFVLLVCMTCLNAQENRRTINWSSLLMQFDTKKIRFVTELENSYLITRRRQDYAMILGHAEYRSGNLRPSLGLSYWLLYNEKGFIVPEWRQHQQFIFEHDGTRFGFLQRTRLENRFIRDTSDLQLLSSHSLTFRPRVLFQISYKLRGKENEKGLLEAVVSLEFLASFNRAKRAFEETRSYAGLWYHLTPALSVRAGYLWLFSVQDQVNNTDIFYLTLRRTFGAKSDKLEEADPGG